MCDNPLETIKQLERLAAWHRITAEYAGADWVWEARLRTAEDLERRAAKIRKQLSDHRDTAANERSWGAPGRGQGGGSGSALGCGPRKTE